MIWAESSGFCSSCPENWYTPTLVVLKTFDEYCILDISKFLIFGTLDTPIPPFWNVNSITISTCFHPRTKLFWKLPFRVECVVNSRLSALQRTKNHQKPFTEFGDRVHQRCQSRSVTEHVRVHAYVRS